MENATPVRVYNSVPYHVILRAEKKMRDGEVRRYSIAVAPGQSIVCRVPEAAWKDRYRLESFEENSLQIVENY